MGSLASPLPPLRSDAQRNRDRIVEAARELFAERGPDVPMATIARRAGIGTATLYRRFPTKDSLVGAVFADQFAECVTAVDDALADPDPWRGFCTMLSELAVLQTVHRGFSAAFLSGLSGTDMAALDEDRSRAVRAFHELIERAKAAGRLRPDFVPADLALVVAAVAGLVTLFPGDATETARRMVAYLLAGFSADHGGPPLPPSPLTIHHLLAAVR
ncbi:TetR/AcrR family transcriptional regulator [Actinoplanes sp. NPDC051851]|uniref:TetR/AcrR family transcriptional regulator n=1 Tax=Actinoplanes sp. NPDC051851 TaxID=3154753 RepID=UPI003420BB85